MHATTTEGEEEELAIKRGEGGFFLGGAYYQTIEAFTKEGESLGRFTREDLPEPKSRYLVGGGSIMFLVTRQGIYPVPREYINKWEEHISEIIAGSE